MSEQLITPVTTESLRAGLSEIRRRRHLCKTILLTFFLAMPVFWLFADTPLPSLAFIWPMAVGVTSLYAFYSLCPRCSNQFASRFDPWAQQCVHCGLRLCSTDQELKKITNDSAA